MKKFGVIIGLIIMIMGMGFSAEAKQSHASGVQLQLIADHVFWSNEAETLSGYGSGLFLLNLNNGMPLLLGYGGAMVSSDKVNLYLLGVTMNDPFGWSVGPSVWLEYDGDKNYFFIEGDYNCPFMSSVHDEDAEAVGLEKAPLPPHTYYGLAEYRRKFRDNVGAGLAIETFGAFEEDYATELAYGPYIEWDRLRLWLFLDEMPLLNDELPDGSDQRRQLGLRFRIKV